MVFLLCNIKRSLQDELDCFFRAIGKTSHLLERAVTKSAFTQARKNLKKAAFIELNQHIKNYFYREA